MEALHLKAKSRQEVADEYGICVKTLVSRLEAAGVILDPGIIFPKTLKIIYDTLGLPPNRTIPREVNYRKWSYPIFITGERERQEA